jgi:hypothetical protein
VHTGFLCGHLRERDHLEDSGVDVRLILKRILEKWDGAHGLDRSDHGVNYAKFTIPSVLLA